MVSLHKHLNQCKPPALKLYQGYKMKNGYKAVTIKRDQCPSLNLWPVLYYCYIPAVLLEGEIAICLIACVPVQGAFYFI